MHTYYEIHPLALMLPPIEEEHFSVIVQSIQDIGQTDDGLLVNGLLIDGVHRQKACKLLGIEFRAHEYAQGQNPNNDEILKVIYAKNYARRHFDDDKQRARIASKFASAKKGERTRKFAITQESEMEAYAPISIPQAAEMFNVSEDAVKKSRTIDLHGTPEIIDAVDRGDMTISKAEKLSLAEKAKKLKRDKTKPHSTPLQIGAHAPISNPQETGRPRPIAVVASARKIKKELKDTFFTDAY